MRIRQLPGWLLSNIRNFFMSSKWSDISVGDMTPSNVYMVSCACGSWSSVQLATLFQFPICDLPRPLLADLYHQFNPIVRRALRDHPYLAEIEEANKYECFELEVFVVRCLIRDTRVLR